LEIGPTVLEFIENMTNIQTLAPILFYIGRNGYCEADDEKLLWKMRWIGEKMSLEAQSMTKMISKRFEQSLCAQTGKVWCYKLSYGRYAGQKVSIKGDNKRSRCIY
jgi:hypothetical protein